MLSLTDAINDLAELLESDHEPGHIFRNPGQSLKHQNHEAALAPVKRRVQRLMTKLFRRQRDEVLRDVRLRFRIDEMHVVKEDASHKAKKRSDELLPLFLALLLYFSIAEEDSYAGMITGAIVAAERQLAPNVSAWIPPIEVAQYVRDHGLQQLSATIAGETRKRLRQVIAEALEAGGDSADVMKAIRGQFAEFSTARAKLIAQTETATVYGWARHKLAVAAKATEKRWSTASAEPCELICIPNEGEEWIGIGKDFGSGHARTPGHPNCWCSTDYRISPRG